ncbi:MAG TPA: hypothetical protein EYO33_27845, partial [Phycisphaerales bacterium]|nr:hypothetical protein [Phycisphaerales bacterium]
MTQAVHVVKYRMEQQGATHDGEAGEYALVDLFKDLSYQYGRNIRQGNVAKLVGFDVGPVGRESGQHEGVAMGVGTIEYVRPTRNRVKAWKAALSTALSLRKLSGRGGLTANKVTNYDFRVGLRDVFGGTINQAAFVDEDEIYLHHTSDAQRSVFQNWNAMTASNALTEPATTAHDSFGLSHAFDDELVGDEDVNIEALDPAWDGTIYNPDQAELAFESFYYDWMKGGRIGGASDDSPSWGVKGTQWRAPAGTYVPIMCGLLGLKQSLA